jgi:hypothetical protein
MTESEQGRLEASLGGLQSHFDAIRRCSVTSHGLFRCVLRSALTKAMEFASSAQQRRSDPFFLTATLRGVCEDLIVLSFIATANDRDDVTKVFFTLEYAECFEAQSTFFGATRAWQPVVKGTPGSLDKAKEELRTLAKKHGWLRNGKPGRPTVKEMAKSAGLLDLYSFMYAATSKWVHFNPHMLLRMGWGDDPASEWTASTSHFKAHYQEFNEVYSKYLLLRLGRAFIQEFDDPAGAARALDALESDLVRKLRWPELITHEELRPRREFTRSEAGPRGVEKVSRGCHDWRACFAELS